MPPQNKTEIIHANPVNLTGGVTVTVPPNVNPNAAIPQTASVIEASILLADGDKLSTTLSFVFTTSVSADNGANWRLLNSVTWNSYGPGGKTVTDPDGTVRVNPDPRLQIGVIPYRGQQIRFTVLPNRNVSAGGSIQVF